MNAVEISAKKIPSTYFLILAFRVSAVKNQVQCQFFAPPPPFFGTVFEIWRRGVKTRKMPGKERDYLCLSLTKTAIKIGEDTQKISFFSGRTTKEWVPPHLYGLAVHATFVYKRMEMI